MEKQKLSIKILASLIVIMLVGIACSINANAKILPASTTLKYKAHVSDIGDQAEVGNGAIAGTTGMAKSMEALTINADVALSYRAHVANIGWQDPVTNGQMAGTKGQANAIEAIEISVTGADAAKYDVVYRAHVANIGWQEWVENGAKAGTTGEALPIEAIQILLVEKSADLSAKVAQLEAENAQLQKDLETANSTITTLEGQLATAQAEKTVVFVNGNGATFSKVQSGTTFADVTKPTITVEEHKTLAGWSTDGTEANIVADDKVITEDTVLFPVITEAKEVTVKLYNGEDDKKGTEVTGYVGETLNYTEPVKSAVGNVEFTFKGWYEKDAEGNVTEPAKDITLAAKADGEKYEYYAAYDVSFNDTLTSVTGADVANALKYLNQYEPSIEATIVVPDQVTISSAINVPENVTVEFKKNVTVADKADIIAENVENIQKAQGVTITKTVTTTENGKVQKSLNNEIYDIVNVTGDVSETDSVKVTRDGAILQVAKNKTLTATKGIDVEGELTIQGAGNITTSTGDAITVEEEGKLTVAEGTGKVSASSGNALTNNGELTVNGGTFDATTKDNTSAFVNEGNATINGGEFTNSYETADNTNQNQTYYTVINHDNLTITGGKFTNASNISSLIESGYYTSNAAEGKEVTLTITGGDFAGGKYVIKNDYASTLTVTGGKFASKGTESVSSHYSKSIFKAIGNTTLDFSTTTTEQTSISLEAGSKVVLVGDQKIEKDNSTTEGGLNTLVVKGLNKNLVKGTVEEKDWIVVETAKNASQSEVVASDITVYADGSNFAKIMNDVIGKLTHSDATKNKATIILTENITIQTQEVANAITTTEGVTIDLNGKTLTVNNLVELSGSLEIKDSSADHSGKIYHGEKLIFGNNDKIGDWDTEYNQKAE